MNWIVCLRRLAEFDLNESAQNRKFGRNRIIADHSNRAKAAQRLGIGAATLYRKLKQERR